MTVKFYGLIADHIHSGQLDIPFQPDTETLLQYLEKQYPGLLIYSFRLAVNNEIIELPSELVENDSIALIPPFPGG